MLSDAENVPPTSNTPPRQPPLVDNVVKNEEGELFEKVEQQSNTVDQVPPLLDDNIENAESSDLSESSVLTPETVASSSDGNHSDGNLAHNEEEKELQKRREEEKLWREQDKIALHTHIKTTTVITQPLPKAAVTVLETKEIPELIFSFLGVLQKQVINLSAGRLEMEDIKAIEKGLLNDGHVYKKDITDSVDIKLSRTPKTFVCTTAINRWLHVWHKYVRLSPALNYTVFIYNTLWFSFSWFPRYLNHFKSNPSREPKQHEQCDLKKIMEYAKRTDVQRWISLKNLKRTRRDFEI